jgi:hypothetical protein
MQRRQSAHVPAGLGKFLKGFWKGLYLEFLLTRHRVAPTRAKEWFQVSSPHVCTNSKLHRKHQQRLWLAPPVTSSSRVSVPVAGEPHHEEKDSTGHCGWSSWWLRGPVQCQALGLERQVPRKFGGKGREVSHSATFPLPEIGQWTLSNWSCEDFAGL